MNIAIISDIHGNSFVLEQALKQINGNGINQIYFLGDAVNYYPDCNEVIELLKEYKVKCIKGNHDFMVQSNEVIEEKRALVYKLENTRKNITKKNLAILKSWPSNIELTLFGKKILMVHGSPSNKFYGYIYPDTDLSIFKTEEFDFVFTGHTHHSMIRKYNSTVYVNPGSIGMPRDFGLQFSYATMNVENMEVKIEKLKIEKEKIVFLYKSEVHSAVLELLDRK